MEPDTHDDLKQKLRFSRKAAAAAKNAMAAALHLRARKVERGTKHNPCKEYYDGKIMKSVQKKHNDTGGNQYP